MTRRGTKDTASQVLVTLALTALSLTTGVQSYLDVQEEGDSPTFATIRLLVLPTVLLFWFAVSWSARRKAIRRLDIGSLLPIATVTWFGIGSIFSDDPVASMARAVALFAMVWGSFAVLGPALVLKDGGRSLVAATFWSSLLIAILSATASMLGSSRGWSLIGDRYQGPLSATSFGPLCMAGVLSAITLCTLEQRRSPRVMIALGGALLLVLLVLSRARGSYVAITAALLSFAGIAAYRRSPAHLCIVVVLAAVFVASALQINHTGLADSESARFLRINNEGMLNQRLEVWGANVGFWQEHPFFGVGLGREARLSVLSKRSHSAYLSALNEGGVPALALLLSSLGYTAWRLTRLAVHGFSRRSRAIGSMGVGVVVAAAVLGVVETTLINAASSFNLFVWLTMGAGMFVSRLDLARLHRQRELPAHVAESLCGTSWRRMIVRR